MKKTREQGNFPLRSRTGGAFAAHTADVAKVVTLPFSTQQVSLMAGVLGVTTRNGKNRTLRRTSGSGGVGLK